VNRGDLYIAVFPGDYGKPRPVLIVQNDGIGPLESRIICPLTTFEEPVAILRLRIGPTPENGLELPSFIMIEKIMTLPALRFRKQIGTLDAESMAIVGTRLAVVLGLV
jgi:mRNA interferase MazF